MNRVYDMATGEYLKAPTAETAPSFWTEESILLMLALQPVETSNPHRNYLLPPDLADVSAATFVAMQD